LLLFTSEIVNCFSATKFYILETDFLKSGSVAVLRSLIRILRASLAQIDTEIAEKYAKLGKAATFRSVYDIRERNPVPAFGL